MLFNSLSFAFFLPVVFFLYWFAFKNSLKKQNIFLFAVSYFFYGCWDWRFLFLLAFSTFLDFYSGLRIYECHSQKKRRAWLILSVVTNLAFLGFFKYYNFFIESFADLLALFGFKTHYTTLNIILPVGISFYTFHGLSYVFDIYNKKIRPTTDWINYTLFVSFFPLLVAGPIERATHLLPQVEKPRTFDYNKATDGMRQILWGLFKKIVIADNCAIYVNQIFANSADASGSTLLLGAVFFAFQIYCDFSGYSDIALGTARLLGFELLQNFKFPYFSRSIAEFWRRWHISLSSWFRDYLYIPLGGSRGSNWKRIRNVFIIFLVSGFWHGANWTFIVWGGLNALFILPSVVLQSNRNNLDVVAQGRLFPKLIEVVQLLFTFSVTVFAWIFFRAESVASAFEYIKGIFDFSIFSFPQLPPQVTVFNFSILLFFILLLFFMEWVQREKKHAFELNAVPSGLKWSMYSLLALVIILFGGEGAEFIYFQF